ncbi:TetR/AcrR family transcriptional regulator [Spectribacter hydrogenoxidans]|uniref:TetR/AcrR family transcriptional regulator n=1 Tax=Spectribacter hydrogenoxidans TaxID=3075608 RepID=A0ABU3BW99_9GAMM|nr:TetR/AcrR family transcriptional regulator [Salinisphaera sp. W335]MDT0633564.1 TetR/AcrR family transcriptional regulator [Salinisphaera sp. W335]
MVPAVANRRAADELRVFRRDAGVSMTELCRAIYAEHGDSVSVQNETIAVANLARIVDATLAIANRKGFAAMSLRDLARRTGLSLGGLYAYFQSKDELVAVIQRQGQRQIEQVLRRQVDQHVTARARLDEAIRAHVLLSEILRPWFVFLYMEARHLGQAERRQAVAMEEATEEIFAAIIREGQADGSFRDTDALAAAAMLKAVLQDWYLKHGKHGRRGQTAAGYARAVQELATRYLAPTPMEEITV